MAVCFSFERDANGNAATRRSTSCAGSSSRRGAEVIHLGHNRSVQEIVDAAIQEDAQGIAITSYQGGHVEFFKYMVDLLAERGANIKSLRRRRRDDPARGDRRAARLRHRAHLLARRRPRDGPRGHDQRPAASARLRHRRAHGRRRLVRRTRPRKATRRRSRAIRSPRTSPESPQDLARGAGRSSEEGHDVPVLGITGTGGAGKSSLIDELVRRFLLDFDDKTHRHPLRRPVQAQDRRRAARRPHPHERDRQRAGLHALAGHAQANLALSAARARRDRRLQGARAST